MRYTVLIAKTYMRFPVFARGANPRVDAPILRKSKTYVEQAVNDGRADWVDPADHKKGIVCREILYFGEREPKPEPKSEYDYSFVGDELRGVIFADPNPERNRALLAFRWELSRRELGRKLEPLPFNWDEQAAAVS